VQSLGNNSNYQSKHQPGKISRNRRINGPLGSSQLLKTYQEYLTGFSGFYYQFADFLLLILLVSTCQGLRFADFGTEIANG